MWAIIFRFPTIRFCILADQGDAKICDTAPLNCIFSIFNFSWWFYSGAATSSTLPLVPPVISAYLTMQFILAFYRTMQYFAARYDFYINLCTVHHDNSSCRSPDPVTENKTIPAPVMACVSKYPAPKGDLVDMLTNIGSVASFRPKHDVRSGLFVELLHGDKSPAGRANCK